MDLRTVEARILNEEPTGDVRSAALNTVNKDYTEGALDYTQMVQYIQSEHSPIRRIRIEIVCEPMNQFTSVHFRTHGTFQEHFVSTGRSDRTQKERSITDIKRHIIDTNPMALIDMMRSRLCKGKVSKDTYEWAVLIKEHLMETPMDTQKGCWLNVIGKMLVPNCVYRCGCPESRPCGLYSQAEAVDPVILRRAISYNNFMEV